MSSDFLTDLLHAFRLKWSTEKRVLQHYKITIIALCIAYYVLGVVTNLLRNYTISRPALWDFGFEATANINYSPLYNLTVIFRSILYLSTIYSILKFYATEKNALLSIIVLKFFTILVGILFLRGFTLISTQLPPPHPFCTNQYRAPFTNDSPIPLTFDHISDAIAPWNLPIPFSIFPRILCGGDHTFSIHVIGFILCVLSCIKYSSMYFSIWTVLATMLNMYMLIAMRLNYSLDIWVGTFTSTLVFLLLDKKLTAYYVDTETSPHYKSLNTKQ